MAFNVPHVRKKLFRYYVENIQIIEVLDPIEQYRLGFFLANK